MTRGETARAQRRRKEETKPLPPALRAELDARVREAAARRDRVVDEAKRQRTVVEREARATCERVRASAQENFKTERERIRLEIERRALGL